MYLPKSARFLDDIYDPRIEVSRCVKQSAFEKIDCNKIMGYDVRKCHNTKTNKRYITLTAHVAREPYYNIYNIAVDMVKELDIITH